MKKHILILGGLGFLGRNLVEAFMDGYIVTVFDRGKRTAPAMIKIQTGDFTRATDLESVFQKNKIDLIIHSLSTTIPSSSDPAYDVESNVVSTIRLLDLMKKYSVPKIVFLSSGGTVYGLTEGSTGVSENHPTDPISSHGIGKLTIEKYLQLYHRLHGIDFLIIRPSNPFGQYHISPTHGFINVALQKLVSKENVDIWGDGEVVRDYVYVKDCVAAIRKMVDLGVSNEIVNVGSGEGHSLNQVLAIIKEEIGEVSVNWREKRNIDVPRIFLDISKLKSLVPFDITDIRQGIRETYRWLKNQA